MELSAIPVDDAFIVYRPLLPLAFVANRTMVDLALSIAAGGEPDSSDAMDFLDRVGFLQPDPPAPGFPSRDWAPTTAVLLLTNQCSLRCTYCYADAGTGAARATSVEHARTAIDIVCRNALALGAPRFDVCFHGGGEPMRAWTVMRAAADYARAKEIPCELTMVSNGVWSTAQREWVLRTLDGLTISCDGGPSTQDRQRPLRNGGPSFDLVLASLKTLDAADFRYGIRMTATAPWKRFPDDVRHLCERTACREFQVEPAFDPERGTHRHGSPLDGQEFVAAFLEAYDLAAAGGRRLTYSGARPWLRARTFCTAPYSALIVNSDGKTVGCYEIADASHRLAELATVGQFIDEGVRVDEDARRRLLDYIETKQQIQCAGCFCRWACAGDCYSRSSSLGEQGLEPTQERCAVNRAIMQQLLLRNILASGGTSWSGSRAHRPAWGIEV
jgi:uncharacterized protein